MLTWLTPNIFQWDTPNPEDEQVMVGHGLVRGQEVVLIDPPIIPALPEILIGLGNVEAIILTTNHHTRGAGYLSKRFECPVYVMPFRHLSRLATAHIRDSVKYREGEVLPGNLVAKRVQVFLKIGKRPYIDEMALVSVEDHAAFIGDALIGHFGTPELAVSKKIMTACYAALEAALPEHVTLLLPGHGFPIAGTYKNQINARHLLEPS